MNIGIDASCLSSNFGGTTVYTYNLLENLSKIDKKNFYFLFSNKDLKFLPKLDEERFKKVIFPSFNKTFYLEVILPFLLKKYKIDIFHSPIFLLPIFSNIPMIVTIHDLSHIHMPHFHRTFHHLIHKIFLPLSMKKAKKIIAVSKYTKEDIIKTYKVKEEKIEVIYLGVSEIFKTKKDEEKINKIKKRFGIDTRYILFVSTIEPRKNIEGLIKSFEIIRNSGFKLKLVLAGEIGWKTQKSLIKKIFDDEDIILTGALPWEELSYLYSGAELLIYPSFYEGFGLPPLEAISCKTAVVASYSSSLPEILGNSAIYVDPYDPKDIASKVIKILKNENLKKNLIETGLKHIEKFSWFNMAKATLSLYESLAFS